MDDLEVIKLSGNTIGVEAAQALANALQSKKKLKQALLSDIFTGRLLDEIPLALKSLCDAFEQVDLLELDLSDNAFGPAGAKPLIDFLSNSKTLQTLRLNNNGLGIGGGTMIAAALQASADNAKAENRPSSLRTIICGRNRLEDGSSKALARAFASHGNLQVVRMPQNGIRPDGIVTIVKGLAECKQLQHIDLQDNTFTAKGSKALAAALSSWPELEILNVSDCLLSNKGGAALTASLATGENKKLRELRLQYNEIQADPIKTLAEAIRSHLDLLEVLELNGNRFEEDDEVVEVLKEALAEWGHEDALDELDDMEEVDEDEEEEEEDDEEEESELVKEAEEAEEQEPKTKLDSQTEDSLVEQLSKTHI
ncbi:RNI-like protein [Backusella circina FSU 941]|nr:RNI-like protein [Backusella circina FSU 941]